MVFHPDKHRAWYFRKDGTQDFYLDGTLRNEELADNFEYKEVDKGDVIEIIYIDKLLNQQHKAKKTKNQEQWRAFLLEIQETHGTGEQKVEDVFNTSLRYTPFGEIYVSGNKIPLDKVDEYKVKYPNVIPMFIPRYSKKGQEFVKEIIHELQKDGLVGDHFDSVQVIFQILKDQKLMLNQKILSKKHSDKYLIYLEEYNHGFLYGEQDFYLK